MGSSRVLDKGLILQRVRVASHDIVVNVLWADALPGAEAEEATKTGLDVTVLDAIIEVLPLGC